MRILILTDTSKLNSEVSKELCHLDGGDMYIQYIDPKMNKPEDIYGTQWDIAIIDFMKFSGSEEWRYAVDRNCKISKLI